MQVVKASLYQAFAVPRIPERTSYTSADSFLLARYSLPVAFTALVQFQPLEHPVSEIASLARGVQSVGLGRAFHGSLKFSCLGIVRTALTN